MYYMYNLSLQGVARKSQIKIKRAQVYKSRGDLS